MTTEPSSYVLTIKKIEASKDGGSTYTTIASGNRTFTITSSQSSGQIVDDYVRGAKLPEGNYNVIRMTLSSTFTLTGRILQTAGAQAGTTFCTGGTTGAGCTATAESATLTNALVTGNSLSRPASITINDAAGEISVVSANQDLPVPFDAQENMVRRYRISFGTSQALGITSTNNFYPNIPAISLTKE